MAVNLPEKFPADRPVPFGKYEILGRIGRGGMANVYLGRPRGQTRLVAIKCMKDKLGDQQSFIDMFVQEGKLAIQLNYDTIVKTYEVGRIHGMYFICMEYIAGVDLSTILRNCQRRAQRLPVPHALSIGVRVLEGLHYAHELTDGSGTSLNLVNRDVSPANIRVSFDGQVKILDFGIAKAASGLTSEIGMLKGKISHMSPEQVRGLPLDRRSDIFSTAVVIHEMLTGEKLFRGDSEFRVMDLVRKADVRPPSATNQRVSAKLDDVILRGLQKLPAERYQTAAEMADDLRTILSEYNFTKAELRSFTRELCAEEWVKEQRVLSLSTATASDPHTADEEQEDYGDLVVDLKPSTVSTGSRVAQAPTHPWWMYALLGVAVLAFAAAAIVVFGR
ncbi:MAG: serine/threonine protein kinase [Deltaproteobacteria bacterium]|nr:serine/threonine protein kinase [Deltaproteobacteria bacterium]